MLLLLSRSALFRASSWTTTRALQAEQAQR
jgi:hypothetical protein